MDISYSVVDAVRWQHLDTFQVAWPNLGNFKKTRNVGPIPNVMAALPNIGGALCLTP